MAVVPAWRLIKMPQGLDAKAGAAAMLQGMTAHYLCHSTYKVQPGDRVLVHAGAGGVGLLLIQMVKRLGGYVFSTVSTDAKAQLARGAGADQVILYTQQDFAAEVKKATDGKGVQAVYDAVGKTTFDKSISCLARRGYMVLYGQASGPAPPIDPRILSNGSLFLTRPGLADHTTTREELEQRAGDVLGWVKSGALKLRVEHVFPLSEAAEAHRQLESRSTTGKLLLIP
jgi:NADPH2:quinone reductase